MESGQLEAIFAHITNLTTDIAGRISVSKEMLWTNMAREMTATAIIRLVEIRRKIVNNLTQFDFLRLHLSQLTLDSMDELRRVAIQSLKW